MPATERGLIGSSRSTVQELERAVRGDVADSAYFLFPFPSLFPPPSLCPLPLSAPLLPRLVHQLVGVGVAVVDDLLRLLIGFFPHAGGQSLRGELLERITAGVG